MEKFLSGLKRNIHRPWYLPLVCFLAFIDLFVLFIPTEGMIVATSALRPRRWLPTALFVTLASATGAFVLAWCGAHYGEPFVIWLLGDKIFESSGWLRASDWVTHYGFWGLWLIALSPLPQQPAILLCALGHMAAPEISVAVFFGRLPKYLLFSYLATKGTQWFKHEFGDESLNIKLILKKIFSAKE